GARPAAAFNAFAGVQATIEEEARARAETLVTRRRGNLLSQGAKMPVISVHMGEDIKIVRKYLEEHPEVSALVLGAAKEGGTGRSGRALHRAGMAHMTCRCSWSGGLDAEAIERLS
ncbi:universal stress protein, partial [Novosphingobium resinovorum]|uniref:universal stress protein n=1 Tax=Novosphingobium resinovorum TaxID=158500 RepID=UPI003D2BF723